MIDIIWNSIIHSIPWQVWAFLGALLVFGVFVVLRALGLRPSQAWGITAAIAAIVFTGVIDRRGRQKGWEARSKQQTKVDDRAAKQAREIEDAVAGRTPFENRKRLKKWARKSSKSSP